MTPSPYGRAARFADVVQRDGAPVLLRATTHTSGPTPLVNPPRIVGASIKGDVVAGDTALALNASSATGRLLPGDMLLAAGVQMVVTAATPAAPVMTPGFVVVPIAPAPVSIPNGTPVLFSFVADRSTYAIIKSYPVTMVDGQRILARDLAVKVAAYGLPDEIPPDWSIIIGARTMSIVSAQPTFERGEIISWDIQARL